MTPINKYSKETFFKRRKKRDYYIKSLKNPFYFKTDKRGLMKKFNTLLILIIFVTAVYFIGYTNIFKIEFINVNGGASITRNLITELATEQQNQRRWFIFKQDQLMFFSTNKLKEKITEQIILDTLKIGKNWPRSLDIEIKERYSEYYLLNQGQIFTLDGYGNIISVLEELPTTTTLPVLNFDERNLVIGEKIADLNYFGEIKNIYELWAELALEPWLAHITVETNYQEEIKLKTTAGFDILLSRQYDLAKQLQSYQRLYQEKLKDGLVNQYVDLRVEGWIYYK